MFDYLIAVESVFELFKVISVHETTVSKTTFVRRPNNKHIIKYLCT
jgi:hypothetical protein